MNCLRIILTIWILLLIYINKSYSNDIINYNYIPIDNNSIETDGFINKASIYMPTFIDTYTKRNLSEEYDDGEYNILVNERKALYDLYSSTNGNHWIWDNDTNRPHWNFTDEGRVL